MLLFGCGGAVLEEALSIDGNGGMLIERPVAPKTREGRLEYGFVFADDN